MPSARKIVAPPEALVQLFRSEVPDDLGRASQARKEAPEDIE
jgi:hypothetical protein